MLDIHEAKRIVLSQIRPLPTMEVTLRDALFRTLAQPVVCDLDDPPFDKAVMDGYAVRAADCIQVPTKLRVVGQLAAGRSPTRAVGVGEAMQINTGAPIPPGSDAVVRVEATEVQGAHVITREPAAVGAFITPRAAFASSGKEVLSAGSRLTPVNLGVAATAGAATVRVHRAPTAAILTTGDELIDINRKPTGAQIRNSNQCLLDALFQSAHLETRLLGTVSDSRDELASRIAEGMHADIFCVTGGVSAGAFDFVPDTLTKLGATIHVHKISIKPGRPTLFATSPSDSLIFALPGNPISAFIGFELLVRPAIAALQGRKAVSPEFFQARLMGGFGPTRDRRSYHPGSATVVDGQWRVKKLSWSGSGDSMGMAGADAMIERPPNSPPVADGEFVSMFLLDRDM